MKKEIINKYSLSELLSFVIVFFVFMGSNFLKFTFLDVKLNIARILMILPIFILIKNTIKNRKLCININSKIIKYCIYFFIIWSTYSIFTIYKSEDIMYYITMNYYICIGTINIIFFSNKIDIEKNSKIFSNIINFSVFVNCIYYIFLYYVKNENIGGFYHNSNDLATVLIIAIVLSWHSIFKYKNRTNTCMQSIFLVTYVISFINIGSRGCVIGVAFALMIIALCTIIKNRKKIYKHKIISCLLLIITIIISVFGIEQYSKRIGDISFKPVENAKNSNDVRTNLIFNGLYFLSKDANIFTGIGTGNTIYFLKNYSLYSVHETYSFHNFWLEILVEYGIIIFTGFVVLYIIMIYNLYKIGKKRKMDISNILIFFWLAFIVASISSSTIITREWIWLMFAFTLSYISFNKRKQDLITSNEKKE